MRSRTGMVLNPANLDPAHMQSILDAIPDTDWDVPDLQPAIKHAGIDSYRYLRALLGLPPEKGQKEEEGQ